MGLDHCLKYGIYRQDQKGEHEMAAFLKKLAFSIAAVSFVLTLDVVGAQAQMPEGAGDVAQAGVEGLPQAKAYKSKKKRHHAKTGKESSADVSEKRMTKDEIKAFQREHGLKPDGILGKKTRKAMAEAKKKKALEKPLPVVDAPPPAPVIDLNAEMDSDAGPAIIGGSKVIPSRYAQVEATENLESTTGVRSYSININGQNLVTVEGQLSSLGISKTYAAEDLDAVVLTTYNTKDGGVCAYKNQVLVLDKIGAKLLDIDNCTRSYTVDEVNGILLISFLERDADRAFDAVWRLDKTGLRRL